MDMQPHSERTTTAPIPTSLEIRQRRKQRLLAILAESLPTLPCFVFELNTLLGATVVDLKRVCKVIRRDPSLTAQVIRVCNSALFGLRRRIFRVEEAAVLMGIERLRTMVLTCSLLEFTSAWSDAEQVRAYWLHSFLTATLSERIARWIRYAEPEQAYLAGLLHDVGKLPLMMVLAEEGRGVPKIATINRSGELEQEREYFGLDHCEVGRWMGISWNFFPCHIDVFESHHAPESAMHDPTLVGIVAAADHFCESRENPAVLETAFAESALDRDHKAFMGRCLPAVNSDERQKILQTLGVEYINLRKMFESSHVGTNDPAAKVSSSFSRGE